MTRSSLMAAAISLLVHGPVAAQDYRPPTTASAEAELRRIDSLLVQRESAYDAARRAATAGEWVEVHEGPFRVNTPRAHLTVVREAARLATPLVNARGGETLRDWMATRPVRVVLNDDEPKFARRSVAWLEIGGRAHEMYRRARVADLEPASLASGLVRMSEYMARDAADSLLTSWLMVDRIPIEDASADSWRSAYSEYATAPSVTLRGCRAGRPGDCLAALGVLPAGVSARDTWYDRDDDRALVMLMSRRLWPNLEAAQRADRCARAAEPGDCAAAARAIDNDWVPAPLSASARQLFLAEVLRAGGRDAFGRLVASRGTLRERMEAAAGQPLDSVASAWRARVVAARPQEMPVSPAILVVALGWSVAFTALGLARRSA